MDNECGPTISGDPNLGALANNGGPTQTHALNAGSIAIDVGNNGSCPGTDQRSYTRWDGLCDIGAYELGATPPVGGSSSTHTLVVYETGAPPAGIGYVYSEPSGIACPGTCSSTFSDGTEVYLFARNVNGMEFLRYEGDCADVPRVDPCVLTMNSYKEVPVRFYPPETRLTWLKYDAETGESSPVSFTNNSITFTSDMLQDGCATTHIILHNSSNRDLEVGAVGGVNPLENPFSVTADNCSGTMLSANSDCIMNINYCPADNGPYNDTFDLPTSDPIFPTQTVEVTGGS